MEEKILTLHPQGKNGVNIDKRKYDIIRTTIIETLRVNNEMTFTELNQNIEIKLQGGFDGSIPWYVTTVKLDLEARGEIERIPRTSPQRLRLTGK